MLSVLRAKRIQLALAPVAFVFAIAVFAPSAEAKLRSPALESSCPAGFSYGEMTNGPWRVEGCAKGEDPRGDELTRTVFTGAVEVNGMLIEGSENLIATKISVNPAAARQSISAGQLTTYKIKRGGQARIIIDREAGGTRIRDEIYRGRVTLTTGSPQKIKDKSALSFDIPTSSNAKINGMRLREPIAGAKVVRGGSEQTLTDEDLRPSAVVQTSDGTIEFKGKLSLGAQVSSLFRDWTSPSKFTLIDGEGLQTNNIRFRIDEIVVPGIGGFRDFSITYNAVRNEWTGAVGLVLGELFPELDFAVTVNGTTGDLERIEATVTGLRVPIGNTGATLREISGFFEPNPLVFGGGVGVTFGPKIGDFYLVEITGTLSIQLEPNFRLEAGGAARVLATGPSSELMRGTSNIVIDSRGILAVSADATMNVSVAGIGARATARGSGAFSTTNAKFYIEAGVSGELLLGFLGDFNVARAEALISSRGWGTCASLAGLISGGVGQDWNDGLQVFTGCDLSDYRVPINTSAAVAGQKQFVVGPNVDKINLEITGEGPEPKAVVKAPGGESVVTTAITGRRDVSPTVSVIAMPGQSTQIVGIKNPKAGIWKVVWGNAGPSVKSIRVARSIDNISGRVSVGDGGRPGQRKIALSGISGIDPGERVELGVKSASGIVSLSDISGSSLRADFTDTEAGARQIVAIAYRNGIPNPARTRVLGAYTSRMPGAAKQLKARRRGKSLKVMAILGKGAIKPDSWVYVLRYKGRPIAIRRGKPGKNATFTIPDGAKQLSIAARPIVGGRVLKVAQRTVNVKG